VADSTFGTAINCMDGRTQRPVNQWIRENFGVDFVDTITEAGPDGGLAVGSDALKESIKKRVLISTEKHGSKVVVIVAHHDCAGNPVEYDTHVDHVKRSLEVLKSWNLGAKLVGVWVGDDWKVKKLGI